MESKRTCIHSIECYAQAGFDPLEKISLVKIPYAELERSDWLENIEQPIRALQTYIA